MPHGTRKKKFRERERERVLALRGSISPVGITALASHALQRQTKLKRINAMEMGIYSSIQATKILNSTVWIWKMDNWRGLSYVHSLMSYKNLRAKINPYSNRRSRKIKQYS